MPTMFEMMQQQKQNGGIGPAPQSPMAPDVAQPPEPPKTMFQMMQEQKGNGGAAPGTNQELDWGTTLKSAAWNLPGSIVNDVVVPTAQGIGQIVAHPVDTATALYDKGASGIATDIGNYIMENYGSVEAFKKTLAEHPGKVGFDLSAALSPASLAAKAPGMVGRAAKGIAAVGNAVDPLVGSAKVAGKIGGNVRNAALALSGQTSATGRGGKVAVEAAQEGAYEGAKRLANEKLGTTFKVEPKGTSRDDILKGQMRGNRPAEEHVQIMEEGIKNIKKKGQAEIDAALTPLWKDRTKHKLDDVDKALDAAEKKVSPGGNPVSPAGDVVIRKMRRVVEEWRTPPQFANLTSNPTALATKSLPADKVKLLGLDPGKATAHDYLVKWFDANRTTEGLDKLKQRLQEVYPAYEAKFGKADAHAKQASGMVSDAVKAMIDKQHGGKYSEALKPYGEKMGLIKQTLETFGYKRDTQSRRLTAMNRDNVVADYGARVKLAQKFENEAGVKGLREVSSGRSMASGQPRNLATGAGSLGALLYTGNPVAAVLSFAIHIPRFVGESARAIGKVQGWVVKPTKAVGKALEKVGISPHQASLGAQAAGRIGNSTANHQKLKSAIEKKALELGYNIHGEVTTRIAKQLTSEDVDSFLKGVNNLNKNEKLMKIIQALGRK